MGNTKTQRQPEKIYVIGPVPTDNRLHERYVCTQLPEPPPPTLITEYGIAGPQKDLRVHESAREVLALFETWDAGGLGSAQIKREIAAVVDRAVLPIRKALSVLVVRLEKMTQNGPECDCPAEGHICGWPDLQREINQARNVLKPENENEAATL